ncbi:HopJ type III effector protein [Ferrimonas pelagia]|uniref:HopJ type III effector protein n=1 Tax=Ferrimonas pelagia TaxID=1177826 RepID=A0ABP9EYS1_9GAMM
MNALQQLLAQLQQQPEHVEFEQVMSVIDQHYDYRPSAFRNGSADNDAGTNAGSAKILSFGQLHQLTVAQTLACFGRYYRKDVLGNPDGDDHQNIRNFIRTGWDGVAFERPPLVLKP